MADSTQLITKDSLGTPQGAMALGLACARMLQVHGQASFYITQLGTVEFIPKGELELDALEDTKAIASLLERGYTDVQIAAYLRGREARHG